MEVSGQLHAPAALLPVIGGWVGPRAGLDTVSKREIPSNRGESNLDHPINQPIASRYMGWAVLALNFSPCHT